MKDQIRELWDELIRRRVVGTGAVYAVVAFVTLQLGEIIFPAYGVGPEGLRALIAALMAAGPLVLAASWVYDMSGPEIRKTPDREAPLAAEAEAGRPSARGICLVVGVAVGLGMASWWVLGGMVGSSVLLMGLPSLLASVTVLFALRWCALSRDDERVAPGPRSVAVLPFECWGPAAADGLGERLGEAIRIRLQRVSGIQVASRYSCTDRERVGEARELARQLNVATLLEGTILRYGSEARVTTQLVDARSGYRVFTKTWDFELEGRGMPEDRMAATIVDDLVGETTDQRALRAV